ncbi:hypothetical protein TB2_002355 [Malus domestica]
MCKEESHQKGSRLFYPVDDVVFMNCLHTLGRTTKRLKESDLIRDTSQESLKTSIFFGNFVFFISVYNNFHPLLGSLTKNQRLLVLHTQWWKGKFKDRGKRISIILRPKLVDKSKETQDTLPATQLVEWSLDPNREINGS